MWYAPVAVVLNRLDLDLAADHGARGWRGRSGAKEGREGRGNGGIVSECARVGLVVTGVRTTVGRTVGSGGGGGCVWYVGCGGGGGSGEGRELRMRPGFLS